MSANPEVEAIVALPIAEVVEPMAPAEAPAVAEPKAEAKPKRVRPAWMATASLGAVAVIAAGALGYVGYVAGQQRDGLHAQLVATTATLLSTQDRLTAAQADARTKKVTADYVAMYVADQGRVATDYQTLSLCDSFSTCRTGSQQLLDDLQRFQADRASAVVPGAFTSSDAALGDALSAAIAADEELISGMDSGNVNKFKDGFKKLDQAMLSVDKAEASLGAGLK
jgi:uncharacterized protein HemX